MNFHTLRRHLRIATSLLLMLFFLALAAFAKDKKPATPNVPPGTSKTKTSPQDKVPSQVNPTDGGDALTDTAPTFLPETHPEGKKMKASAPSQGKEKAPKARKTIQKKSASKTKKRVKWNLTKAPEVGKVFLSLVSQGKFAEAYQSGAPLLRKSRSLHQFSEHVRSLGLLKLKEVKWNNGVPALNGIRLMGDLIYKNGKILPIYLVALGDLSQKSSSYQVLDVQSAQGPIDRLLSGAGTLLDVVVALMILVIILALIYIIYMYVRGLRGSPRELYLLFFTKVTEYSAYGGANLAFILYLQNDVGLSDVAAGSYIGAWSMALTVTTMLVGAVCDAIGVKMTLLIGCYALLFSRFFMPLLDNLYAVTIFGFLPLAIGIAITGPVLKVGIKLFTTRAGATLGFGLFYTLMNVGWAIGAWIFDFIRGIFGDNMTHAIPGLGWEISTYQIIFATGFFLTIPDLIAIALMRRGIQRTEDGIIHNPPAKKESNDSLFTRIWTLTTTTTKDTIQIFASVVKESYFWVYMFMLAILIFVRLTFYHFHYTFPPYGIRVFGEGVKIGSIFGVLNPLLIVFLVPLISALTQKVRSYTMLLVGTSISAFSVFLTLIPPEFFASMQDGWYGKLVYEYWLAIPVGQRNPYYLVLVFFIIIFTIGEAIWSPRLMQFSAEIAPKGREGSYIALAFLPYFLSKFIVGPMSGLLLKYYVPKGATSYPDHYMVWVWIGGMAIISPIGLFVFRAMFRKAEDRALEQAETTTNA